MELGEEADLSCICRMWPTRPDASCRSPSGGQLGLRIARASRRCVCEARLQAIVHMQALAAAAVVRGSGARLPALAVAAAPALLQSRGLAAAALNR